MKKLQQTLKNSISTKLLVIILLLFVGTITLVGTQGQEGLLFSGAKYLIYHNDEIGQAVLNGESIFDLFGDDITDEHTQVLQFFVLKVLFVILAVVVLLYTIYILIQTLIWNYLEQGLFTVHTWKQKALVNIVWLLALIPIGFIIFIIFFGLNAFAIVIESERFFPALANIFLLIAILKIILFTLVLNAFAVKQKLSTTFGRAMQFCWKIKWPLTAILLIFFISLLVFAFSFTWIGEKIPALYGLGSTLTLVLPLAWLMHAIDALKTTYLKED
jgi:hypothetical protein